jgi:BASS family bile acid:Na+ symporter
MAIARPACSSQDRLLVVVNFHNVLSVIGTRAILAGIVTIGDAAGWALGGPDAGTRPVLGLGTLFNTH